MNPGTYEVKIKALERNLRDKIGTLAKNTTSLISTVADFEDLLSSGVQQSPLPFTDAKFASFKEDYISAAVSVKESVDDLVTFMEQPHAIFSTFETQFSTGAVPANLWNYYLSEYKTFNNLITRAAPKYLDNISQAHKSLISYLAVDYPYLEGHTYLFDKLVLFLREASPFKRSADLKSLLWVSGTVEPETRPASYILTMKSSDRNSIGRRRANKHRSGQHEGSSVVASKVPGGA